MSVILQSPLKISSSGRGRGGGGLASSLATCTVSFPNIRGCPPPDGLSEQLKFCWGEGRGAGGGGHIPLDVSVLSTPLYMYMAA